MVESRQKVLCDKMVSVLIIPYLFLMHRIDGTTLPREKVLPNLRGSFATWTVTIARPGCPDLLTQFLSGYLFTKSYAHRQNYQLVGLLISLIAQHLPYISISSFVYQATRLPPQAHTSCRYALPYEVHHRLHVARSRGDAGHRHLCARGGPQFRDRPHHLSPHQDVAGAPAPRWCRRRSQDFDRVCRDMT